jgi:hypothetical protein
MVKRKWEPRMAQIRTRRGCDLLDKVPVLGDTKPKNEDIAVVEKRVKKPDGGDFGSVQVDTQQQV